MKNSLPFESRPPRRIWAGWLKVIPILAVASFGVGFLARMPDVQWRAMQTYARFRDSFITHEQYLPTPQAVAAFPTDLPTETPLPTATLEISLTPAPTATPLPPTPTPVPLPKSAHLEGFRYEAQKPNACGPATLAIGLSYYGWEGNQTDTLAFLKPKLWDKNVRPDEMLAFVEQVGLKGVLRANGDLDLLRRFVSAGYPVIVHKGYVLEKDGWLGHYQLVTAYDDAEREFVTQDSFQGANFKMGYQELLDQWRAFNYTYLVIYRTEDEASVMRLLGEDQDPEVNMQRALARAQTEAATSEGELKAFALFNQGSSLVALFRYQEAVLAFDEARRLGLPWRMLWYQTGPYKAYFYSERYQDVLDLAEATLKRADGLEESLFWRGQARQAFGDIEAALDDYREALKTNPNFQAAIAAMEYLGYSP